MMSFEIFHVSAVCDIQVIYLHTDMPQVTGFPSYKCWVPSTQKCSNSTWHELHKCTEDLWRDITPFHLNSLIFPGAESSV